MHVFHDSLELIETGLRAGSEVVLADLVPILLRHASRQAPLLDALQPVINGWVAVEDALEEWRRRPGVVDGLEVEWLDLERFDNCRHCGKR